MTWLTVILLGLVEGLTEFLPVSSTGHLILVTRALGLHGEGVDAFTIVIQLGALLAAVIYYRHILWQTLSGLMKADAAAQRLALNLALGALPLLVCGYLLGKKIKLLLFHPAAIAAALCVGGLLMIALDRWHRRRTDLLQDIGGLTPKQAALIGLCQVAALWPGTSRSMSCILGGQVAGLSNAVAADFAFLLALPTLGVATVYELHKSYHAVLQDTGAAGLGLGLGVSFVVGWLVIAAFLRYLRRFGLGPFGYYRIALGALVLWLA